MAGFADVITLLKEAGIFDFYFPFLIMFGIMYALLFRSQIFGDAKLADKGGKTARAVNLIVSLGASFFIMAYTPAGITLSSLFANMFGQTLVVLLTLLSVGMIVYMVLGMMSKDPQGVLDKIKGRKLAAILLLFVVLGVGIFFSSGGSAFFPGLSSGTSGIGGGGAPNLVFPSINLSSTDLAIIFLVVVTGLVIFFVAGGRDGNSGGQHGGAQP